MTIRNLACCVCGNDAGRHAQHWNRDTGFGVCKDCIAWLRSRNESEAEILDLYGIEGVNFEAAAPLIMHRVEAEMATGKADSCFVLATSPDSAMARVAKMKGVARAVSAAIDQ